MAASKKPMSKKPAVKPAAKAAAKAGKKMPAFLEKKMGGKY
jgi:hypothetical protein